MNTQARWGQSPHWTHPRATRISTCFRLLKTPGLKAITHHPDFIPITMPRLPYLVPEYVILKTQFRSCHFAADFKIICLKKSCENLKSLAWPTRPMDMTSPASFHSRLQSPGLIFAFPKSPVPHFVRAPVLAASDHTSSYRRLGSCSLYQGLNFLISKTGIIVPYLNVLLRELNETVWIKSLE